MQLVFQHFSLQLFLPSLHPVIFSLLGHDNGILKITQNGYHNAQKNERVSVELPWRKYVPKNVYHHHKK